MSHLPTETLTLLVNSFTSEDFSLLLKPIPPLQEGQLLVHAAAAPINNLDLLKLEGKVPHLSLPFTPGSECSGIVLDAKGAHFQALIGKKISACSWEGSFKEYVIINATDAIVLSDDADLLQASCAYVIPITALGLVDVAEDHGTKAIINNAANSMVGKNLIKICQKKNIELINVVKDAENINAVKNLGARHVLDQDEENFPEKLTELAHKLDAKVALDCIGGKMTGTMLKCLPKEGLLVNYGSLGGRFAEGIDAADLRFGMKMMRGFTFYEYVREKHEIDRNQLYRFVRENMGIFAPKVAGTIELGSFKQGLREHREKMGVGRIIVKLSKLVK